MWDRAARTALVVCAALAAGSCGERATQGRAPSYLIVERLAAAPGDAPDTFSTVLQSDVQTVVTQTVNSQQVRVPTIFEDLGQITFRLGMKDPGSSTIPSNPTSINWITVERYRVLFKRSDGRNTPGVDVPHAFDGSLSFAVTAVNTGTFTLVRAQAKLEPPLRALVGGGGANVISTIAEITFYGRDQAGTVVSATASMSVNFSDWGDRTAS